ncbi:MAG: hypothetical protein R2838_22155 [Caldilineaceae bacterium]
MLRLTSATATAARGGGPHRVALRGAVLPVIADDSCFTVLDLRRELALDTFDILNIKTARTNTPNPPRCWTWRGGQGHHGRLPGERRFGHSAPPLSLQPRRASTTRRGSRSFSSCEKTCWRNR